VEARIEAEEKLMLIKAVQLRYRLKVPREKRAEADRALAIHEDYCPVHQSIRRGFEVRWSAEIEETG
jgi:uncharacterized OsmC-like protein